MQRTVKGQRALFNATQRDFPADSTTSRGATFHHIKAKLSDVQYFQVGWYACLLMNERNFYIVCCELSRNNCPGVPHIFIFSGRAKSVLPELAWMAEKTTGLAGASCSTKEHVHASFLALRPARRARREVGREK